MINSAYSPLGQPSLRFAPTYSFLPYSYRPLRSSTALYLYLFVNFLLFLLPPSLATHGPFLINFGVFVSLPRGRALGLAIHPGQLEKVVLTPPSPSRNPSVRATSVPPLAPIEARGTRRPDRGLTEFLQE